MMNHPTPLAWSYVVLFGGIAIILIAMAAALRTRSQNRARDPRITALDERLMNGEIKQDEYDRRRAEILAEDYEKHRAA